MPNEPQGALRYGGIWADGAFSVSRTQNSSPDTIVAQFNESKVLPQVADMEVWYGQQRILLPRCRLIRQEIATGSRGRMWQCYFEDRRWLWTYVNATGEFNFKDSITQSGVIPHNQLSLAQQIVYLFSQLGESVFMPFQLADYKPSVHFDLVPAITILESMLAEYGLTCCLQWNNTVGIYQQNIGARPPTDARVSDYQISRVPPTIPETVGVYTNDTRFLTDFPLEAIGLDGGQWLPIDQLSYKPANGWDPPFFNNVGVANRKAAIDYVFKYYRPRKTGGTLQIPLPAGASGKNAPKGPKWNWTDPNDFKIGDNDEDWVRVDFRGNSVSPWIWGSYFDGKVAMNNNITFPNSFIYTTGQLKESTFAQLDALQINAQYPACAYKDPFEFDQNEQWVVFPDPVYYVDQTNNVEPYQQARLIMRDWHKLRRKSDFETLRQVVYLPTGSQYAIPGLTQMLQADYLSFYSSPRRSESTNATSYQDWCQRAVQNLLLGFRVNESAMVSMKGFCFDVNVDGAIKAVRFDCSERGECMTHLSWNMVNPIYWIVPEYEDVERENKRQFKKFWGQMAQLGYNTENLVQP